MQEPPMNREQEQTQTSTSPLMPPKRGNDTAQVAVLYTSAPTVVPDIGRAMRLAGLTHWLPKEHETVLKVNISWQHYYPACSTTPWQLDGVIRCLREEGYQRLIAAHNGTVVVKSHEGELRNKHKAVQDLHGVPSEHLTDPGARWVRYAPKGEILVLDEIFP